MVAATQYIPSALSALSALSAGSTRRTRTRSTRSTRKHAQQRSAKRHSHRRGRAQLRAGAPRLEYRRRGAAQREGRPCRRRAAIAACWGAAARLPLPRSSAAQEQHCRRRAAAIALKAHSFVLARHGTNILYTAAEVQRSGRKAAMSPPRSKRRDGTCGGAQRRARAPRREYRCRRRHRAGAAWPRRVAAIAAEAQSSALVSRGLSAAGETVQAVQMHWPCTRAHARAMHVPHPPG